jgi:polysaccharide export outer membrane protein
MFTLVVAAMMLFAGQNASSAVPQASSGAPVQRVAPVDQSTPPVTQTQDSESHSNSSILIGAGDLLDISLYGMPEFQQTARVSGNGDISLPMIGSTHVAGLSSDAAATLIRNKLIAGHFFNNPQVSVLQKEFATQGVAVLGEVQKPGVYPVLGTHKLFDLISAAGGTTPKAGKTVLISHRDGPPREVNLKATSNASEWASTDVEIVPGDTILVNKAGIVYVVGDVRLPGGFVMDSGTDMTVLQALSLAQGPNPTASLDHAKVIHKTSAGPIEEPVPLKRILASKSSDLKLQSEDILFVPSSTAKSVARRSLDTIVQAAVGAAIYRP